MTVLYRRYTSPAQLNTVLLADALRWSAQPVASVYSNAFRRAAQLALNFKLHTLTQGRGNNTRATA